MKFRKKQKKNLAVGVEPWVFGSLVRCVTAVATQVHTYDGIFNPYKDRKYALRTLGNFLHQISQQAFAYIIFLFVS